MNNFVVHIIKKLIMLTLIIMSFTSLAACEDNAAVTSVKSTGQVYLYGEMHGVKKILDREFELWYDHYTNDGMRHLFIEFPYYTTEFLNIWMQSDSDDILDEMYEEWAGAAAQNPDAKEFYQKIKSECPETIFHGTDVGHQYNTTGKRFLEYLESNNQKDSEQYSLAQEIIEQGKYYYEHSDDVYRENKMMENFIREFDNLKDIDIMGIYGGAHTGLDAMDYTNSVPCMANQLKERYGDAIHSEDLSELAKDIEPLRIDIITVNGKEYEASYFGKYDVSWLKDYSYREFWRLENAYDDFKDKPKTGDVLPYDNYRIRIETGQVFVIDYTKTGGSVERFYYRSDGYIWNNRPSTENFTAE